MLKKRPCQICRRWFHPDPRVGARQRACSSPGCQEKRRSGTQASWRARNPDYFAARRIDQRRRDRGERALEPLRVPPPLNRLPWDIAQDEFGPEGTDFLGVLSRVLMQYAQDQREEQVDEIAREFRRHGRGEAQDQIGDQSSSGGLEEAPP